MFRHLLCWHVGGFEYGPLAMMLLAPWTPRTSKTGVRRVFFGGIVEQLCSGVVDERGLVLSKGTFTNRKLEI